jgi:hypothetical protein
MVAEWRDRAPILDRFLYPHETCTLAVLLTAVYLAVMVGSRRKRLDFLAGDRSWRLPLLVASHAVAAYLWIATMGAVCRLGVLAVESMAGEAAREVSREYGPGLSRGPFYGVLLVVAGLTLLVVIVYSVCAPVASAVVRFWERRTWNILSPVPPEDSSTTTPISPVAARVRNLSAVYLALFLGPVLIIETTYLLRPEALPDVIHVEYALRYMVRPVVLFAGGLGWQLAFIVYLVSFVLLGGSPRHRRVARVGIIVACLLFFAPML